MFPVAVHLLTRNDAVPVAAPSVPVTVWGPEVSLLVAVQV
jgi:hypothetical protein